MVSDCQRSDSKCLERADDLPHVVGAVSKVSLDGFHHRVVFTPDGHGSSEILLGQRLQRSKETLPAPIPFRQ